MGKAGEEGKEKKLMGGKEERKRGDVEGRKRRG